MDKIGKLPYRVLGYCATCGKRFGEAKKEFLGCRIQCTEPSHLAQVISADEPAEWWLRKEEWLLKWQLRYSPFRVLREIQRSLSKKFCRKEPSKLLQAGPYLLACFGFIIIALLLEHRVFPSWVRWTGRLTVGLILSWRFVDIFFSNTSITFTSRFPANPLRSVLFSLASFVQIVLCYGYFYCVLNDLGAVLAKNGYTFSVIEAVYYSFGTIATVGYGSLEPKNPFGQLVVASELMLGLYFVVIILAQVGTWTNQSKVELGCLPWDDLKLVGQEPCAPDNIN